MITPVWLDEIQNNKIINKQKKKLLREVLFYSLYQKQNLFENNHETYTRFLAVVWAHIIVINLPLTYKKLPFKGKPYRLSG